MKQILEVEPETMVVVQQIDGGSEVKLHLEEMGIAEGKELTVMSTKPIHMHVGPILLKTGGKEVIVARGWADKVYVEKDGEMLPFLRLEAGEKGTVKDIEGGSSLKKYLSELGVDIGDEVDFIRHLPDDTLVLDVNGSEIKMGEGAASKILVEKEGKVIQLNYLKDGEKALISRVIVGASHKEKFDQMGIKEGNGISMIRKERISPMVHGTGTYVMVKVEGNLVTIGAGLSEKIWVE